ncbi:hypothetical protein [Kitasatospora arboriphila]|uniref:DUF3806 domain-containing protein n=1 Tax=Kitasatospora arboriphila TaxID=258052 RepID=A0ABP4EJH9_9ACTN
MRPLLRRPHTGENLAAAPDHAHAAADLVDLALAQHATQLVALTDAAPPTLELPTDPHDTLVRLAQLITEPVGRLVERQHPAAATLAEKYEEGFGCGCEITLTYQGVEWTLYRSDSAWSLMRADAVGEDGIVREWRDLEVSSATPHPQHLYVALQDTLGREFKEKEHARD